MLGLSRKCLMARPRGEVRPWPWAPLEAVLGGSASMISRQLGTSARAVYAWRRKGLRDDQADELAIRVGLHPGQVWADWFD